MITGRADWEYTGETSGNHGAQTGRATQYMDFASEHDIPGVLVEGWNEAGRVIPTAAGGPSTSPSRTRTSTSKRSRATGQVSTHRHR